MTMMKTLIACALSALMLTGAAAQERFITVASTTSTQDSGLFSHLLPLFKSLLRPQQF